MVADGTGRSGDAAKCEQFDGRAGLGAALRYPQCRQSDCVAILGDERDGIRVLDECGVAAYLLGFELQVLQDEPAEMKSFTL